MNFLGKRYLFFAISAIIILPGLIILATGGLPLSIDFTGGSLLEVTFSGTQPTTEEVLAVYEDANIKDATVQTTDTGRTIALSLRIRWPGSFFFSVSPIAFHTAVESLP